MEPFASAASPYAREVADVPADREAKRATEHTYKLVVAYDGTDYFGWQVQPGRPTIQGTLAEVIRRVTGASVLPQGSGRTDAGVHAEGQSVSVCLPANIPADRLCRALNRVLPPAIRVVSAEEVQHGFHARAGVVNKTYEYRIFERRVEGSSAERICPPQQSRYVWDCRWPLRLDAMQQAAAAVEGAHDFTSFTATDPDRSQRSAIDGSADNVRTIYRSEWSREGSLLLYRVTGNGFLHHMVRNLVGTFVEVGSGRIKSDAVPLILQARDRRSAGRTAPPEGLHLLNVVYAEDSTARSASLGAAHA